MKELSRNCALIALLVASVSTRAAIGKPASAQFSRDASEFVAEVTLGINIGNTFDCPSANELDWGNQRVTRSLLRLYKTKGINAVRLPVTWGRHFSVDDRTHPEIIDAIVRGYKAGRKTRLGSGK